MARTVSEDELQQGFIDVINKMIEDSEHYINLLKGNMKIAIISRSPLQAETLATRMRELQGTSRPSRLMIFILYPSSPPRLHSAVHRRCPLPGKIDTKKHTKVE